MERYFVTLCLEYAFLFLYVLGPCIFRCLFSLGQTYIFAKAIKGKVVDRDRGTKLI